MTSLQKHTVVIEPGRVEFPRQRLSRRVALPLAVLVASVAYFPFLGAADLFPSNWSSTDGWASVLMLVFLVLCSLACLLFGVFWASWPFLAMAQSAVVDGDARVLTHGWETLLLPYREVRFAFAEISSVEAKRSDWSEGLPSWSVRICVENRRAIDLPVGSEEDAEESARAIRTLIDGEPSG